MSEEQAMGESVFGQVDETVLLARMNAVIDEDADGEPVAPGWVAPAVARPVAHSSGAAASAEPAPDDPFAFILTGPPTP